MTKNKKKNYKKLAEQFLGKEGKGRNHEEFIRQGCPLCKEVRAFAKYLESHK